MLSAVHVCVFWIKATSVCKTLKKHFSQTLSRFGCFNLHRAGASETKPIRSMCQHSTAFILAPPENLVPIINATAAAKCQFVHPHPVGFFSAPQFERHSFFFIRDRVPSSGIGLAGYVSVELITSLIYHLFSLSVVSSHSLFLSVSISSFLSSMSCSGSPRCAKTL